MLFDRCETSIERWPLLAPFRIARGAKTEAVVVTVTLRQGELVGRGEGCPYPRYGDTPEAAKRDIENAFRALRAATDPATARRTLRTALTPGSARNALDCALWDFEAKSRKKSAASLAGLPASGDIVTCFTLSLDTPELMADAARQHASCPVLKLKLGDAANDADRMHAVRAARPDARLVADANEGWQACDLSALLEVAADVGIELIEQPLPAGDDAALEGLEPAVPLAADESAEPGADIAALAGRYQAINIKLDKTGGLTAAIELIRDARAAGLSIMIGSMVSTSLSMAPAALLASQADWVDLDSPLLLARDRPHAMTISEGLLSPPRPSLWG